MKVLGKKKENTILEVTPYEFHAIQIALMEWSFIEAETTEPERKFDKVLTRIHKAINKFESLPLVKEEKKLGVKNDTLKKTRSS